MLSLVVVPATCLLVRGACGGADTLAGLREATRSVLVRELSGVRTAAVLGAGPVARAGRLRPTLAAAGIADAQVPLLRALARREPAVSWEGAASTGASVALLALADAHVDLAVRAVDVVEVPGEPAMGFVLSAADRLRGALTGPPAPDPFAQTSYCGAPAPRGTPGLVVVADQPSPGVDAVLAELTASGRWTRDVLDLPVHHEHLPDSYRVTVYRLTT